MLSKYRIGFRFDYVGVSEAEVWVRFGYGLATRSVEMGLSSRRCKKVLGFAFIGQSCFPCFVISVFIRFRGVFRSSLLVFGLSLCKHAVLEGCS